MCLGRPLRFKHLLSLSLCPQCDCYQQPQLWKVNLPTEKQTDLWILKQTPPSTQGPNTKRLHQVKSSCPREGRRVMLPGDIQVVSALHSRPVRSTPNNTDRHLTSHYHNDSFHRWTHQWIQDFFQIYRRCPWVYEKIYMDLIRFPWEKVLPAEEK